MPERKPGLFCPGFLVVGGENALGEVVSVGLVVLNIREWNVKFACNNRNGFYDGQSRLAIIVAAAAIALFLSVFL